MEHTSTVNDGFYDKYGRFIRLPYGVLAMMPELGPDAFFTFTYLLGLAKEKLECTPSLDMLMNFTEFNRDRLACSINTLIEAGLLQVYRRPQMSYKYCITLPQLVKEETEKVRS